MAQKPIEFKSWRDLPLMTASLGDMSINKTGSWRNVEPHHVEHTPPCSFRCPAGNDVVGFVTLAAEGRYEDAWRVLASTTPFPGTCGRVCPHPCESECNRDQLGGALNIHTIERFISDKFLENPPKIETEPATHKRVAVIGSGPAGLSAAYQLALKGHTVTVYEEHSKPGGMLKLGIPDYRLPTSVLDAEIGRIVDLGVEIITDTRVGREILFENLMEKYDAVFAAVGFTKSRGLGAKNDDGNGIMPGIEVLRNLALGLPHNVGKRAFVVGGGNTAMDAARSLLRTGCEVRVMYRRTRAEMPAIAEEIDELLEEGIPIDFLCTPIEVLRDSDGNLTGAKCIKMQLGKPDESGRRRPEPVEGSEFVVETDTIITAIGEVTDLSFLPEEITAKTSWNIPADALGRTFEEKLFAGGDVADGAGTVTAAIGYGRRAAIAIHGYLLNQELPEDAIVSPALRDCEKKVVRFEDLNTAYFEEEQREQASSQEVKERISNFEEVRHGFTDAELQDEAKRCFSCGTCPACDNCYIFCPDACMAPVKDDPNKLYIVDFDYCKGCGLCAAECPRDCIVMKPVH